MTLIALTLGLYEFVPRYRPSDRQLLQNADFSRDLVGWWTTGHVRPDPKRSATVVLESAGAAVGRSSLRQTVELAKSPATLIVRAEVAAEIFQPADGRIGAAWIIVGRLVGSSFTSRNWEKGAFTSYLTTSSHGWRSLEAILPVPPGSRMLTFEAGVGRGVGSMLRITDLAMVEASERLSFRIGRFVLMTAWALMAAWGSAATYRNLSSGWARLAFTVLLCTAALALLLPESARPHASPLWGSAPEATGHTLLFFLLALTCRLGRPEDPFWFSFGALSLLAAASEVVQSFIPGRGPELHDWFADLGGILAGLALSMPALRLYSRIVGRTRVR